MLIFVIDDQDRKKSFRNYMKFCWLILLQFFCAISLNDIRALFLSDPHFRIYIYSIKSWKEIYHFIISTLPSLSKSKALKSLSENYWAQCRPSMPMFRLKASPVIYCLYPDTLTNLDMETFTSCVVIRASWN